MVTETKVCGRVGCNNDAPSGKVACSHECNVEMAAVYAATRRGLEYRICPTCAKSMESFPAGEQFCAPECVRIPCAREGCFEVFRPRHPRQLYCSNECRQQQQAEARKSAISALDAVECADEDCDTVFIPKHHAQIYCRASCRPGSKSTFGERLDRLENMIEQLLAERSA